MAITSPKSLGKMYTITQENKQLTTHTMNDTLKELSISIACLLDEPSDISINDIEHLQDLVTKLENTR